MDELTLIDSRSRADTSAREAIIAPALVGRQQAAATWRRRVAFALCVLVSTAGGAQVRQPVPVRVEVVDSLKIPVQGADISVVQGLTEIVAAGTSDRAGLYSVQLSRIDETFEVVARKIGFIPARRFVVRGSMTLYAWSSRCGEWLNSWIPCALLWSRTQSAHERSSTLMRLPSPRVHSSMRLMS